MEIGLGFLDDDLYKIKVCYAINELYPKATAEFRFINRGKHKFSPKFYVALCKEIYNSKRLLAYSYKTTDEINWLSKQIPDAKEVFWKWLLDFEYNSEQVSILYNEETQDINISIRGPWKEVTLWEIKLLYIISNLYYQLLPQFDWDGYKKRLIEKRHFLFMMYPRIELIEFGTRRRASFEVQESVLLGLAGLASGTSNMKLSMKHNIPVSGTVPHEWIMGISALESLRYANRYAFKKWADVFSDPGIALSDTFGVGAFLRDFDVKLAKLYDGTRQDSGDPLVYMDNMIQHYRNIGVDPSIKKIVFSDSLDFYKAKNIIDYSRRRIRTSFGIGTYLSNDFENSSPLNIVIKPWSFNNIPVVKLGEGTGKVSGDEKAVEYTKWVFGK